MAYCEFYVACNPPLLAPGVADFMERKDKSDIREKIAEILYEPDGPWFKIIALGVFRSEITEEIASLLAEITEQATRPLEQPVEHHGSLVDVQTTTAAIPWSAIFESREYQDNFVEWQFPEHMKILEFKTIWPSDSSTLDWDLDALLHMQSCLGCLEDQTAGLESLGRLLSCEVSHDLRKTKLYIGTDSSLQTAHRAHEILDSLFDLARQAAAAAQHVIYAKDSQELFSFKYLSHMSLDSRTYPQDPTDNPRLRYAVCMRAIIENSQGRWVADGPQGRRKAQDTNKDAKSIMWLTSSFLRRKYVPKRAQRIDSKSGETVGSSDLSSYNIDFPKYNTASRPSPRQDHNTESQLEELNVGDVGDDLIAFDDMHEISNRGGQPQSWQHHQPIAASLLDDDPLPKQVSSLSGPRSSEPKLAKKTNHRSRPHIVKLLEKHLQMIWPILLRCPGFITVRLQFGRFYLKDLSSADVDFENGPRREMKDLLRELEAVDRERIGFSTTLSRMGSDADVLINYPTSPWAPLGEDITYQIECTVGEKRLIIDMDAETFGFSCHGPTSELGCTFVHCVHQAWDLNLAVSHSSNLNLSPCHKDTAEKISKSLHIGTEANGKPFFELVANKDVGNITAVRIRHVTRYKSAEKPDSILSVAKFQRLRPSAERDKRRRWTIAEKPSPKTPNPDAWFEAYISSSKLETLLKENVHMSLGGRLSWDAGEQEDIWDGLFGPALEMVAQLDEVGASNDNGSGGKLSFNDSTAAGASQVIFW